MYNQKMILMRYDLKNLISMVIVQFYFEDFEIKHLFYGVVDHVNPFAKGNTPQHHIMWYSVMWYSVMWYSGKVSSRFSSNS